jgi:hypothetical protein
MATQTTTGTTAVKGQSKDTEAKGANDTFDTSRLPRQVYLDIGYNNKFLGRITIELFYDKALYASLRLVVSW